MDRPRTVETLLLVIALIAVTIAVPAAGQCAKPPIPASGLPTAVDADVAVTYSDGYKTLATLTYPTSSKPACGWPLVVFVHGYGGKRSAQPAIASRGFAVLAYDVRGQGDAKNLNPATMGLTLYGPVEKYDLAEEILFARTRWKNLLDPGMVAVTGASQGGIHSWFAAAYSGRSITVPGRGTIAFPVIAAVAPQNFIPDVTLHFLRGDTLFSMDGIARVFGGITSAVVDPAVTSLIQQYFLDQDPVGLANTFRAEPGRAVASLLPSSRVPVYYVHAHQDGVSSPLEAVRIIEALPGGVIVRSMISTIGHGSPSNTYEGTFRNEQRIRWFDRYLWNLPNGVEREAPVVLGVMPPRAAEYQNSQTLWDHRYDASFRPADLATARRYLTSSGKLEAAPGSGGAPTTLRHRVAVGYTPRTFTSHPNQWSLATILANIPLSERVFALAPLAAECELGGRPRVSLRVVPTADRFTLAAMLLARVPGETQDFMLAIWGHGVVGATQNVPMRVEFDLPTIASVLPAGTELKLVIRNHWLREFPMPRQIVTAPYFVSGDVQILHGTGGDTSWIDLPFRSHVRVGLVTPMHVTYVASPQPVPLTVRAGAHRSGRPYLVAGSLSGQVPGTPLPGGIVPLNVDGLTVFLLLTVGSPFTPGFVGTLDAQGGAGATLDLRAFAPLPPALAGVRITLAAWVHRSVHDLSGDASNPADVILR